MKSPNLRLIELLRRLGIEGSEYLEIQETIQPVVTVGELDALVPVLAPRASVVGGTITGGGLASTRAAFIFAASSGVALRIQGYVGAGNPVSMPHETGPIGSEAFALAAVVTLQNRSVSPVAGPARGTFELGHAQVGNIADTLPIFMIQSGQSVFVDFLIPPGFSLSGGIQSNTAFITWSLAVSELEMA